MLDPSTFSAWVEAFKAGGPYGVAVALAIYALRKDAEARAERNAHALALKETHDQVVALVAASTEATTEMKGAISALKDALLSIGRKP